MAQKFHLGKNGPGRCTASKRACPVGGSHFDSMEEAEIAYAAEQGGSFASSSKKDSEGNLPSKRFSIGDGTYSVEEYRTKVLATHGRFSDGGDAALRQRVVGQLNLTDQNGDPVSPESISFYGDTISYVEDIYVGWSEDDWNETFDQDDYYEPRFAENPNYLSQETVISGYYNEDSHIEVSYRIPEGLEEDIRDYGFAQSTKIEHEYATKPGYPAWASLPKNVAENGQLKGHLPYRSFPSMKSAKKFQDVVGHEEVVAKSDRLIEKHDRNIERYEQTLRELQDEDTNPTGATVRNVLGKEVRLNKSVRNAEVRRTLSEIERSRYGKHLAEQRKANFSEISPEQVAFARRQIRAVEKDNRDRKREWVIADLSDRYPSSDANLRRSEAEKWVGSHPEILDNY